MCTVTGRAEICPPEGLDLPSQSRPRKMTPIVGKVTTTVFLLTPDVMEGSVALPSLKQSTAPTSLLLW